MTLTRRVLTAAGLLVLAAAATLAPTAGGAAGVAFKPVIGKPVTVPAKPLAGKPFVVTFKVTRSDTGAPLKRGTMICDPSVSGKVIRHVESFKAGVARLSFVVPAKAEGKVLKVKLTIKAAGASATRVAVFPVAEAVKPSLSIGDVSAAEGNAATTLSFPVTLSAPSSQQVSVDYATADGTATAPGDYTTASGTLTFKAGEKAKTVTVAVVGDTTVEQDESFAVSLTNPVNATIADGSATGTIKNDDVAPKSGHYAGTTSQGYPVSFDVAAGTTSITNVDWVDTLNCSEVPVTFTGDEWSLGGGIVIPLAADWTWGWTDSYSDASGSISLAFSGKLAVPGNASGALQVNVAVNTSYGTVHCSSGNVTWTAAATG